MDEEPKWLLQARARVNAESAHIRVGSDIHLLEMACADYSMLRVQLAAAQARTVEDTAKALRVALELYGKNLEEDFDAIAIELHHALSPTPNQEKPG